MRVLRHQLKFLVILMLLSVTGASGHDETTAVSKEQAEVYQMYSKWRRPKGNFSGIEHRKDSCCNRLDCGVVRETRRKDGQLQIRVCTDEEVCDYPLPWYTVDPAVVEENQPDPVESPDGRTHACVMREVVVCYVGGGGV